MPAANGLSHSSAGLESRCPVARFRQAGNGQTLKGRAGKARFPARQQGDTRYRVADLRMAWPQMARRAEACRGMQDAPPG